MVQISLLHNVKERSAKHNAQRYSILTEDLKESNEHIRIEAILVDLFSINRIRYPMPKANAVN